jgi:hypothetical protein
MATTTAADPTRSQANDTDRSALLSLCRDRESLGGKATIAYWPLQLPLLVLLSIAIPLGILLPQKYIEPLPINILMPSTVFPDEVALNRLTDSYVIVTV